jgi:hypothetical protein
MQHIWRGPGLVPLWRWDNLSRDEVFWHHWQHEGQDWQCEGQDSRRGGLRTHVKTITGKTSCSRPVGSISNQFPTRWTPSEQSPPSTTSLRLTRQAARSHEQFPTSSEAWSTTRGATPGWNVFTATRGGPIPRAMQAQQLVAVRAAGPDRSLNVCTTAQPSHRHHLQLCSTQASPEALKHPLRRAQAYC